MTAGMQGEVADTRTVPERGESGPSRSSVPGMVALSCYVARSYDAFRGTIMLHWWEIDIEAAARENRLWTVTITYPLDCKPDLRGRIRQGSALQEAVQQGWGMSPCGWVTSFMTNPMTMQIQFVHPEECACSGDVFEQGLR